MWWKHALFMFVGMVALQVFFMPFVMVAELSHVRFSVNQGWMGAVMGAAMVLLGGVMMPMPWWAWGLTVFVGVIAIVGVKQQWFVTDREYLHDMIPHHSMALVTSRARFNSVNPEIQTLARKIYGTQVQEIAEMADLESRSSTTR